jgi:hypothetical protein
MTPQTKPTQAVVAGVVYAAGWVVTALADSHITAQEWGAGVVGLAVAVGAVYGVTNRPT